MSSSSNIPSWYLCRSKYVVNSLAYSGCLSAKSLNSSEKYKKHRYYSVATESKKISEPASFNESDFQLGFSEASWTYAKYLGLCCNSFPQKLYVNQQIFWGKRGVTVGMTVRVLFIIKGCNLP